MPPLSGSWANALKGEFSKDYYKKLFQTVGAEYKTHTIYPPADDIFNAFHFTPLEQVKVVILGQDPYHEPGQAHGLCFSVKPEVSIPPSLVNIYKELEDDLGCYIPNNGYLEKWARQGVLMLNTVLTVRAHQANSHKEIGWEQFTDAAIKVLAEQDRPMVFILWGRPAQRKKEMILRVCYDTEGKGMEREPQRIFVVQRHMQALGSLAERYADAILTVQGVFVGSWGEMHTSAYLTEEHIRQMWDMLKIHTTDKIRVAVRTPAQWRTLIPEEKFQKREWKALGLFDDGIFGSTTHLGTFGTMMREAAGWEKPWSRKEELEFIEQISRDFPCGGEAIAEADPDRADQILTKDAKAVISEMQKMHLAYLNLVHDTRILNQWKAQSCGKDGIWSGKTLYEYVSAHLGYRFVLKKVEMLVPKRDKIKFIFEVENCGFASLFQEAQLFLIQENEKERKEMLLSEEVQKWHGGSTYKVETETGAMKGNIFLQIRRKKDGKIISFANKNSADRLLIGSLHSV